MGDNNREPVRQEVTGAPEPASRLGTMTAIIASALARALGLVLIMVGVWAAVMVVIEAWNLYSDPDSIQDFAASLERASGLDEYLAGRTLPPRESPSDVIGGPGLTQALTTGPGTQSGSQLKVSYLFAWPLVVLLLLLIGKLASLAIEAGARLTFRRD